MGGSVSAKRGVCALSAAMALVLAGCSSPDESLQAPDTATLTASSESPTSTAESSTQAAASPQPGQCDLAARAAGLYNPVDLFCDGFWHLFAEKGTSHQYLAHWDGAEWDKLIPEGRTGAGGDFTCHTRRQLEQLGADKAVIASLDDLGAVCPSDEEEQLAGGAQCGSEEAYAAVVTNLHTLPADQAPWNPDTALNNYDSCAALSWAQITLEGATASSPYHIMLFHKGEYLGTATAKPQTFAKISRVDDRTIDVEYHYPKENESMANSTGRAYASFTWSEAEPKVQMSGDVPDYDS